MKEPGLTRAERVLLNRLERLYELPVLPNPEQIRYDVFQLLHVAARLNTESIKLYRRLQGGPV